MFNINFLVKNKKLSVVAFIVFLVIVFGLMIRKADHLKSVAFTKDGQLLVGEAARRQAIIRPTRPMPSGPSKSRVAYPQT